MTAKLSGRSRSRALPSTRTLLICAALAALQTLIYVVVAPMTPVLAAAMPPLYALVAGVHSFMPFLARLLTRTLWTATITAAVAGVLVWPFSAIGPLVLVTFLAGSAAFDVALLRSGQLSGHRLIFAAGIAGAVLFVISLPVFSPQHLTVAILAGALLGRMLGEIGALIFATVLVRALRAAGIQGS
ncbi:hypothetical protein [Microbacterium sp.]|uniref:hypothetical protein n=1 Tax=Microbacterium sp. TaxID=51671 RepID=UPI002732A5B9|nr:hypothetical protein [Microbacterium sp.]MDP3952578.1 hypothetical protein [Microbacterium sp.]